MREYKVRIREPHAPPAGAGIVSAGSISMISVVFETHSTSLDNELQLASGHYDSELSPAGEKQARELGDRYQIQDLAAIFCSDLKRSYRTAEIAFADRRIRVVRDRRLRECDYGELTRGSSARIAELRVACVDTPFPGGESYRQVAARVKDFLREACRAYRGKTILVIGHRATLVALEHWTLGLSLNEAVQASREWQPGWRYIFECTSARR